VCSEKRRKFFFLNSPTVTRPTYAPLLTEPSPETARQTPEPQPETVKTIRIQKPVGQRQITWNRLRGNIQKDQSGGSRTSQHRPRNRVRLIRKPIVINRHRKRN